MATKMSVAQNELIELSSVRNRVSPEEWQTRIDLAACYRKSVSTQHNKPTARGAITAHPAGRRGSV